ncbi:MAG: serpin family protein [Bacteroidales bacterium]|nr:serpin family protein [Bacteroidales bacterium]
MAVLLSSCEKNDGKDLPGEPAEIILESYQRDVISSANRFAFDLFNPVLSDNKGTENIIISPFSITSALSMTLNGAAGETFEAMRKSLGLEESTLQQINDTYLKLMTELVPVDNRVTVEIANSVWVEKRLTVKQPFISALQTWYKAEVRDIDVKSPGAVDMVNDWIAGKTHDKITEMLDYLDSDLAMLLVNAIYFNGKWKYQFDEDKTTEEPFYVTPSAPKNVPMMHLDEKLRMTETANSKIVEIPYGQGNYSMVVVLPDEGTSAEDVANSLTPAIWESWMENLEGNTVQVELSMPGFKYKYKRTLNDDLERLGMGIAFTGAADFSNISDQALQISRVLHEAFIEVNEEGTEAAAATVVEIRLTSMPETNMVTLNRPFLYFIRETSTGTILFMGKVADPALN